MNLGLKYTSFVFEDRVINGKKIKGSRAVYYTKSGEYSEEDWNRAIHNQMEELQEQAIFNDLLDFLRYRIPWIKTEEGINAYALRLYSNRIFDNPDWVEYEAFKVYRGEMPEFLL